MRFLLKGALLVLYTKLKYKKNTERLKFPYINICPNILHVDAVVDADTDYDNIAIALAVELK